MSWRLSRFRTGDIVTVRSKEEILATLDKDGTLDGMPFMPEMLQYCGRRLRVDSVAHKTCETAKRTWQGRRLDSTVHLAGLRCDGSAHGGCQADCKLFWRDEWLAGDDDAASAAQTHAAREHAGACDEAILTARTRLPILEVEAEPRYACQATQLYDATRPLAWWDPRQYVRDVATGNHSVASVARALWLATLRNSLRRAPRGYRMIRFIRERMHQWLVGSEVPDVHGVIPMGQPTPSGRLDLKAGERVRIRSKAEIVATLHQDNKNRGLSFDQEMVRYCGSVATVRRSVTKIINEGTGTMMHMKQPCIILEQVVCTGQYSSCRLMCPRELPAFWRELWLERVAEDVRPLVTADAGGSAYAEDRAHSVVRSGHGAPPA